MEKDRLSEEATYRRIDNALWDGFVASVSVDENALRAPSLHSVNFSEAVWRIHDENPQNALNLFYCDTSEGVVYDEPRQNVSEIASVVNTGDGRGLLCPEFYMPVTPDRAAFGDFIDANADFIASALAMVPASCRKTIMYGASYIMLGEWCNYYAPQTDIKVHTADLMRAYAVDPRFAECAGIGFGGVDRGNEEYVRWAMKLVRYYALEGAEEVKELQYSHPLLQSAAVPEEDRRRSMMHNVRYVFRATAPEATPVFSDREGSGNSVDVGKGAPK